MRSHQSINNTTKIVIHRQLSPVAGDFKQAARMHSLLCLITNSFMWSNENAQYRIDLTLVICGKYINLNKITKI